MNKDLKKLFRNLVIGCLISSTPVAIKELTEFSRKGGEYDLEDEDENKDNK